MPTQPTKGCVRISVDLPRDVVAWLSAVTRPAVPDGPPKAEVIRAALESHLRRRHLAAYPGNPDPVRPKSAS